MHPWRSCRLSSATAACCQLTPLAHITLGQQSCLLSEGDNTSNILTSRTLPPILKTSVILFKHPAAQHVHFLLGEEAPVATAKILLGETGKLHAIELHHVVAQALEDTTHDTVLAAVNLDAHLAVVALVGVLDGIGMHLTVFLRNLG